MNLAIMDSCRDSFRKLGILVLPLQSQYILSLLMFVVKNRYIFKMNSDVHTCNTRSNQDLHLPPVNLTVFQKGGWYSDIKFYNHLPLTLNNYHVIFLDLKGL
jgi:hypothetical protein